MAPWRGAVPLGARDPDLIIDLLPAPRTGENCDHLCLVVKARDVEALAAHHGVELVGGPALRWGARGLATSLYVRDPDGNLVELRAYPEA